MYCLPKNQVGCRLCSRKFELNDKVVYCHTATVSKPSQPWKNEGKLGIKMNRNEGSAFAYHEGCFQINPSRVVDTCIVCGKGDTLDNPIVYGPNILLHYDCEKIWARGK